VPERAFALNCRLSYAKAFAMSTSSVISHKRSQAVRLPAELRLPEGVTRVQVRALGCERIIAPCN